MEARHVELEFFARKAAGYKAALDRAPGARTLELSVVAAILRGFFDQKGWDPRTVPIVDLMAGTGLLTEHLADAGFKRIVPVEVCSEMRGTLRPSLGIRYADITQLSDLPRVLEDHQPGAVVSLAGFHHLLAYEGGTVNRTRSIVSQVEVLEMCLQGMLPQGLLLILDIAESNAELIPASPAITYWNASVFRGGSKHLGRGPAKVLAKSRSIADYRVSVAESMGTSEVTGTLRWFREVVNEWAVVGHNDIALSREFVMLASQRYRVMWSRIPCPWVFQTTEDLRFFLWHKFGFEAGVRLAPLDPAQLERLAADYVGITPMKDGQIAVGWHLAALAIHAQPNAGTPGAGYWAAKCNRILIPLVMLLTVRALMKWLWYPAFEYCGPIIDVIGLVLGGMALEVLVEVRRGQSM